MLMAEVIPKFRAWFKICWDWAFCPGGVDQKALIFVDMEFITLGIEAVYWNYIESFLFSIIEYRHRLEPETKNNRREKGSKSA